MNDAKSAVSALLARQAEVYGQLDALSQRQWDLLEADDAEGLAAIVDERGELIARATALAGEIERAVAGAGGALSGEQRERAAGLEAMARAILQRDGEQRAVMERRRDELAAEIAGLSVTRRAAGAYGVGGGAGGGAGGSADAGARYKDERA